jgi:hypothetical protein
VTGEATLAHVNKAHRILKLYVVTTYVNIEVRI